MGILELVLNQFLNVQDVRPALRYDQGLPSAEQWGCDER